MKEKMFLLKFCSEREGFYPEKQNGGIKVVFPLKKMKKTWWCTLYLILKKYQGPVAQSIVSLRSSLRGQLLKCFTTL